MAARFGVSVSSVPKWVARYRATGSVAPGQVGGHRPWLLESHREQVHALAAATPHLTLDRLQEQLASEGITVCWDTVWRFLRREGLRFKKTQFALEQMRAAVTRKRERWRDLPGFRLHRLKGDLAGFWSVTVSGNWRVIFRFEGSHASDVDQIDYH